MVIIQYKNVSITADKDKKILTIKVPYSKVIDYTKKAHKEVFANLYHVKLNDNYAINLQLYGKKVAQTVVETNNGIDL